MALTNSGEIYVWGDNSQGQLSTGNNSVINFPFLNTNLIGIDSIAAGKDHYIILKNDSTVWSVGNNDYGQLGVGNLTGINQAQQITSINNIIKVGAGEYHSFAINSNGDLFVWGNNSSGQLGLGDLTNRLTPTISTISNITNASLLKSILLTIIGISFISPLIYVLEKMRILFKKNKKEISFILSRNN